ncbi:hypothetical protein [Sphingomonas sp. Leaf357]|uniref:hypothetical protein n=1 Tax=Sphingomonas sp. Leaf357 TaxID=1736350 RepID=UPI0012E2073F|nr:hypothetical protein [Sphingomonas sp. Leaf357]
MRDNVFAELRDGFGEPGWDLLLALSAHDLDDRPLAEPDLLAAAGVSHRIAKRYLDWLASSGLIIRTEGAPTIVALSERGRKLMTDYLDFAI